MHFFWYFFDYPCHLEKNLTHHKIRFIPIEIFNELWLSFPENSPSYMTETRWVSRFKDGTEYLQDFQRPERPITVSSVN